MHGSKIERKGQTHLLSKLTRNKKKEKKGLYRPYLKKKKKKKKMTRVWKKNILMGCISA